MRRAGSPPPAGRSRSARDGDDVPGIREVCYYSFMRRVAQFRPRPLFSRGTCRLFYVPKIICAELR